MSKFVKVPTDSGNEILLNMSYVLYVEKTKGGCCVHYSNLVKNDFENLSISLEDLQALL